MSFCLLNLSLQAASICIAVNVKNIAGIAKAALHMLPGKSSLNVRSVCPGFPGFPVCPDDHDDHDEHDYNDNHNHDNHDD